VSDAHVCVAVPAGVDGGSKVSECVREELTEVSECVREGLTEVSECVREGLTEGCGRN
jgi:hypothetical protein